MVLLLADNYTNYPYGRAHLPLSILTNYIYNIGIVCVGKNIVSDAFDNAFFLMTILINIKTEI